MKTATTIHKTLFGALAMGLVCILASNVSASERDSRDRDHDRGNVSSGVKYGDNHHSDYGSSHRNEGFYGSLNFSNWGHDSNRYSYNGGYYGGVQRGWNEGHYETVCTRVLVCAAHTERRWVEPVYQTLNYGATRCVHEGFWQDVFVPARYEDRRVQVWRSGC